MSSPNPNPILNPAAQTGPHAEPDDREEIYFQGSPPMRAAFGRMLGFDLATLVILAVGILLLVKGVHPWWLGAILILLALGLPLIPALFAISVRYRVSNYRIDFERGILSKNIDTMELWHVEDLHFHQSLLDRMLNVGNITVLAHDDTLPQIVLRGVPNPRPLYETLKQRVIAVKRQRGVIKMDPG